MRRGSESPASSRARSEGSTPASCDDATLDLRDRLLGDDEDVVLLEARAACSRLDEERGEIVSLLELRDPAERDHAQLLRQGSPVTRIPAWPL